MRMLIIALLMVGSLESKVPKPVKKAWVCCMQTGTGEYFCKEVVGACSLSQMERDAQENPSITKEEMFKVLLKEKQIAEK